MHLFCWAFHRIWLCIALGKMSCHSSQLNDWLGFMIIMIIYWLSIYRVTSSYDTLLLITGFQMKFYSPLLIHLFHLLFFSPPFCFCKYHSVLIKTSSSASLTDATSWWKLLLVSKQLCSESLNLNPDVLIVLET